eukprot:gene30118-37281_t
MVARASKLWALGTSERRCRLRRPTSAFTKSLLSRRVISSTVLRITSRTASRICPDKRPRIPSRALARPGVASKRGQIVAKAVVTKRIKALTIEGKKTHTVGLPLHFGFKGVTRPGYLINTLTPPSW